MKTRNLAYLFGNQMAEALNKGLESVAEQVPGLFSTKSQSCVRMFLLPSKNTFGGYHVSPHLTRLENTEGSARVQIFLLSSPDVPVEEYTKADIDAKYIGKRIDIPFHFIDDKVLLQKYTLYHIRFHVPAEESRLDAAAVQPLFHGYVGITKRHFLVRFNEHYTKAMQNSGFLLHSVWHGLMKENILHHPVIQVAGTAETLKGIYELEEEAVAKYTLTPMGLNAIPGGMAGIKMMHELRLLNSTKVGIEERDAAIARLQSGHNSPCTHYRSGHIRRLSAEKVTYVKPCWVNLKTSVPELQEAA